PYSLIVDKSGKSVLLEDFNKGDQLLIGGVFDAKNKVVEVSSIQNLNSLKKTKQINFYGTYIGKVINISNTGLAMDSMWRGRLDAYADNKALISDSDGGKLNFNQIRVGNQIKVTGLWDKSANAISEIKSIQILKA
ncbi:MAG TPA: hypothetical protein VF828_04995, partial [Patescibacteria group bacterium]